MLLAVRRPNDDPKRMAKDVCRYVWLIARPGPGQAAKDDVRRKHGCSLWWEAGWGDLGLAKPSPRARAWCVVVHMPAGLALRPLTSHQAEAAKLSVAVALSRLTTLLKP